MNAVNHEGFLVIKFANTSVKRIGQMAKRLTNIQKSYVGLLVIGIASKFTNHLSEIGRLVFTKTRSTKYG